jgi:hypothetical protein
MKLTTLKQTASASLLGVFPLLLLLLLLSPSLRAATAGADEVGRSLFVRGAVSVQSEDGSIRLLEKHKSIFEHERIVSASKSFTILEMNDGTRITLRPDTDFVVDKYEWKAQEARGEANYSLLKGGMRALTGLMGKNNPDASTVTTPFATMGIRGTEYDARICEQDCAEDMAVFSEAQKTTPTSLVVGRVALIKGEVKVKDIQLKERLLDKGGPVYLGDTLVTTDKAFVVVVFRDDTRLTLRPSSEVVLKDYFLGQEGNAGKGRYVTELLKGGLRSLTGNIGKQNPDGFKVVTSSATMGIRGTGFDVLYKNPTWVNVWSGAVDFEYKDGSILVGRCGQSESGTPTIAPAGACNIAKYDGSKAPEYLKDLPEFMRWPSATRPDHAQFVGLHLIMFDAREHDFSTPGLYVTTYDGHIRVKEIDIGAYEALFSDGNITYRLKKIPPFQWNDPYPKPGEFNERLFELFGFSGTSGGGGANQCEVQ